MDYKIIRQKFLDYLKKRGHSEIVNASLVPENDPTILFTPAGMSPIVPYLLGEKHPQGTTLTNVQRCIRVGDIEEVGDAVHLTFFEMTGNWSLNDYFKEEAIDITFSFLVEELGLDPQKLYGSVFEGDQDSPKDEVSIEALRKVFNKFGITADAGKGKRIQFFGKDKNWWELPAGGPCGPDSEIFYDTGKESCGENCNINCDCGKFIELGNNVFMEFLKKGPGQYEPLGRHNVDFGGGLARWAMFMQGVDNVFDTDIYLPIKNKVEELAQEQNIKSVRIVTEHINTAIFILMDSVIPSNKEAGYILRRIIRRAIRHAKQLGIPTPFTKKVAEVVIKQWNDLYPELNERKEFILSELEKEEEKFARTVEQGEKELIKSWEQRYGLSIEEVEKLNIENTIKDSEELKYWGKELFRIFETYGLPFELSLEILNEILSKCNTQIMNNEQYKMKNDFEESFKQHQEKSRSGQGERFKGGLADTSEASTKYHTATHLLNAALKEIVGEHVYQKGSNITPERMRFDFPNETKLTPEQVQQVEDWVNDKIDKSLPITCTEMTPDEATELKAEGVFGHRYGEKVKVYCVGDECSPTSREICGGPHVTNTKELGKFKIVKQENVGAGVKRIKAVLV